MSTQHQLPSPPDGGSRPGRPSSMITPSGEDREKWLQTRLGGGAGMKFRDAARAVLTWFSPGLAPRAEVVEHLHAMTDELERWKDAWASERVAHDRDVREALKRTDCEIHEQELAELRERVNLLEADRRRAEDGRLALVSGLHDLDKMVDGYELQLQLGRRDLPRLIDLYRKTSAKVHERHRRAWSR